MNRWEILLAEATRGEKASILILVLMLFASAGVWCVYLSGRLRGLPTEEFSPPVKPILSLPAVALMVFLIGNSLAARFIFSSPRPESLPLETVQTGALESLVLWALLFGSLWIVPGMSLGDYGFRFREWPGQLGLGGLAFLASLLPVYALLLATVPLRSVETLHPFLKLLQSDPGPATVFWIGLSVAVVAPLSEELIYRVVLQTTLGRWLPAWAAIAVTAGVFCLVHGWPDMIPLLPLAVILGWVYHRHRSYLAAVAAHSLFNSWMFAWAVSVPAGS